MASRRKRTDITLFDYARLHEELIEHPRKVLRLFRRCRIGALDELRAYRELRQRDPAAARRIAAVAEEMGIALTESLTP